MTERVMITFSGVDTPEIRQEIHEFMDLLEQRELLSFDHELVACKDRVGFQVLCPEETVLQYRDALRASGLVLLGVVADSIGVFHDLNDFEPKPAAERLVALYAQ